MRSQVFSYFEGLSERPAGDAAPAAEDRSCRASERARVRGRRRLGDPRHPHESRVRGRVCVWAQARRAPRRRRAGTRACSPRAARGVARVHRRPSPRLHLLRALPRQPGAAPRELAPAARGGRRRRARGPGAVAGGDPLRPLRPADAGRIQRQDAGAQLQLRARQPAVWHRALPDRSAAGGSSGSCSTPCSRRCNRPGSRRRCARSSTQAQITRRGCARPSFSSSARRSTPTACSASSTRASPRTDSSPAPSSASGSSASPRSARPNAR